MVAQLNGKIVLVAEAAPPRRNVLCIDGEASIVPTGYDGVPGLSKRKGNPVRRFNPGVNCNVKLRRKVDLKLQEVLAALSIVIGMGANHRGPGKGIRY